MPDVPLSRVKRVTVTKLFGIYDHVIELSDVERVTIIHGPNGVGKTRILELVAALFSGELLAFTRVPLQSFQVELTDCTTFTITVGQRSGGKEWPSEVSLTIRLQRASGELHEETVEWGRREAHRMAKYLAEVPWLEQVGANRWFDERAQTHMTYAEVLTAYRDMLPEMGRRANKIPRWFTEFCAGVNVHLIETQRLLRVSRQGSTGSRLRNVESEMVPTVRDYAKDLQRNVTETLAAYASNSQSLDQSFPQRLLLSPSRELSVDEIKVRMNKLDQKRERLKELGLLDDKATNSFDTGKLDQLDETQRRAMTLYVNDTAEKLGVLDDLARRIELLRDTVNGKFKNKAIRFDRERGFIAVDSDEHPLDLDALSSGEQHELVLLYDLLFRVQPNTLVLIDEPELSLHVIWQKRFLSDLLEIVKTAGFDALVATHSPFIVGDRSDLLVALAAEAA